MILLIFFVFFLSLQKRKRMIPNKIYFDNASTTKPFSEVINIVTNCLSDTYGNPSSVHSFGRTAKSQIENVRKKIAKELYANASEIIFTSGGTEANNLILRSAVRDLGVKRIISSPIEHHSVLHTLEKLSQEYAIPLEFVPILPNGNVDVEELERMLQHTDNQPVLVSLMHINNEIGNILPLKKVAEMCKKYGAYFHSDTVQSVGHFPLNLAEIPVDFITASAHKFHAIKGVGFVYIRKGLGVRASIFGGEQEKGVRAGTEPLHNIIAMGEAFCQSYQKLEEYSKYIQEIKKYFIENVKIAFPDCIFNGTCESQTESAYTIVNVGFPSLKGKGDVLLFTLDLQGVMCSKGSACQSGSVQNSHVLTAFLPEENLKIPSLRFSFSIFNTKEEIDTCISILKRI